MNYYDMQLDQPSNSMLKHFRVSPMAYRWHIENGSDEPTDSMRFGRAMHMALLEPELFAATFLVLPAMKLGSKADRQEFYERSLGDHATMEGMAEAGATDAAGVRSLVCRALSDLGRTVMTPGELWTLQQQVKSLNLPCHALARGIVLSGIHEMEIHWEHGTLKPKAKIDGFDPSTGLLYDLKSCQDASAKGFRKALWTFEYHFQAAYYTRGLKAVGHDPAPMDFVLSEKEAPFHWNVTSCDPDDLDRADARTERDLARLQECIERDEWPGLMGTEPEIVAMRRTFDE